ncbi:MAG: hypothetical protein AAF487_05320 [Bacteroidota bacterium]
MKSFKFRVVLDGKETVFRDVLMDPACTLEDFHHTILNCYAFSGQQMASFYRSNENWDRGEEFPLMDMFEKEDEGKLMSETKIEEVFIEEGDKFLYIYDFLNMKIFMIEMMGQEDFQGALPHVVLEYGEAPPESAESDFSEFQLDEDPMAGIGDDPFGDAGDDWDMESFEDIDNLDI